MVDIPRQSRARARLIRNILVSTAALAAVGGISWYVSRLKPAAPSVEIATLYTDTVKRGTIPRQVRGIGRLVPEEIRWVPAATEGRVEKKLLEPGAAVTAQTVILELSNPLLEQETTNAEWDWKFEQSSYDNTRVTLEREQLNQKAELARLQSEKEQALLRYQAKAALEKEGLYPSLDLKQDKAAADQLAGRLEIEKQRMEIYRESAAAQLSQCRTRVNKAQAFYLLRKSQLEQLKVRAGVEGVLQDLPVEVGQRVGIGTNLARVANPRMLKAELDIPETQAKDIQLGQEVSIDTRNGVVPGRISRIDPAVKNGSVTVDVRLESQLPKGARPDLSVEGTILLEKLTDILYVGRPTQAQPDSRIGLFRIDPDGKGAERVPVLLGRSSVNVIEIKEGLKPGDKVILSDLSDKDSYDRIRLK